jgi:predicted DNA-binding transcriptional regulator AlpA
VLSKADVMEKLGIRSYLTLRSWVINNGFPAPRELGSGNGRSLVGWLSSEVDAWLVNRPRRMPKGSEGVERWRRYGSLTDALKQGTPLKVSETYQNEPQELA